MDHQQYNVLCLGGLQLGGSHAEKRGDNRQKKPLLHLMKNNEVYQNCKFFWGGSGAGLSEWERVGLCIREGVVEQALVGGLLWLGCNSWQFLCGNLLGMGSLAKYSWVCW